MKAIDSFKTPERSSYLSSNTYESSLGVSIDLVDMSSSDEKNSDTKLSSTDMPFLYKKSASMYNIPESVKAKSSPVLWNNNINEKITSSNVPEFSHDQSLSSQNVPLLVSSNMQKQSESAFMLHKSMTSSSLAKMNHNGSNSPQVCSYAPSRELSRLEKNRMLLEAQLKSTKKRKKRKQKAVPMRATGAPTCCIHNPTMMRHVSCCDLRNYGTTPCQLECHGYLLNSHKLEAFTVRRSSSAHSLRVKSRVTSRYVHIKKF